MHYVNIMFAGCASDSDNNSLECLLLLHNKLLDRIWKWQMGLLGRVKIIENIYILSGDLMLDVCRATTPSRPSTSTASTGPPSPSPPSARRRSRSRWAVIGGARVTWPQSSPLIGCAGLGVPLRHDRLPAGRADLRHHRGQHRLHDHQHERLAGRLQEQDGRHQTGRGGTSIYPRNDWDSTII